MREKLIDLLGDTVAECMPTECLADIADHLIANDVVPVVRCKDCKHMNVVGVGYRWCKAWERIQTMGDDGFCCFGERKDNG